MKSGLCKSCAEDPESSARLKSQWPKYQVMQKMKGVPPQRQKRTWSEYFAFWGLQGALDFVVKKENGKTNRKGG